MPVLQRETDVYPHHLLESDLALEGDWWAMYTMSRQEKKLMRKLREADIAHYSPVIERRYRTSNGRMRKSKEPLFANYVFVCGDEMDRYKAVCTGCVSQHMPVIDKEELVADLGQIHGLVKSEAPLSPESRLEPGQKVRIRNGPFAGYEGTIVRRDKDVRLHVYVRFMDQGVSVSIDDCQADPI